MSYNIRFPNINSSSTPEQVAQIRTYLHQLVEQLNFALTNIESGSPSVVDAKGNPVSVSAEEKNDPVSTFNGIKALIIKSSDIVKAYYEEIDNLLKLSGEYVAEATFPDGAAKFIEQTSLSISANSKSIEQFYTDLQKIISDIDSVENQLIEVNAHIKTGLLYYDENGVPIYGLEVGQRNEINGEEVFNKYARFTANKLSFYDSNDNEVAYVSDRKLYITQVEVIGSFKIGGFVDTVLADRGVVTKWSEYGGEG